MATRYHSSVKKSVFLVLIKENPLIECVGNMQISLTLKRKVHIDTTGL